MRNRQFQIRTARRQIIADLAKGYYRPPQPIKVLAAKPLKAPDQLKLEFNPPQPLADLFPMAYE